MAGVVYSTRFLAGGISGRAGLLYVVPAGFVAVLRDMSVGWSTGAAAAGTATINLGAPSSRIWVVAVPASQVGAAQWAGNLVLPAGETLVAGFSAVSTGIYFTASGYLLSLP